MKNPKQVILLMMTFLAISCNKKDGCTIPSAENYDPEAKNNDGSCEYLTSEDSATIYLFAKDDTIIFLGDTLHQISGCPTDTEITNLGYTYQMRIDKDYFDDENTGQTFFSFGNPNNQHFTFDGRLQLTQNDILDFQINDLSNSSGINPSVNTSCLTETEKEVVIIDFN